MSTTPEPKPAKAKKSTKTDEPVEQVVSEYPERPYSEAVTEKHAKFLVEKHPQRFIDTLGA